MLSDSQGEVRGVFTGLFGAGILTDALAGPISIRPDGKVVYNQFHIDVHRAIDLIKTLRRDG